MDWLCCGFSAHQPLWVILCRLQEKGRKEIVEEMKEREQGRKKYRNESEETEEIKTSPHYPYLLHR